eukprot:457684_1
MNLGLIFVINFFWFLFFFVFFFFFFFGVQTFMAMTQAKLEGRFHFIFIAIALSVLLVTDPEKIYTDASLSNSYRNHVLLLSAFYHLAMMLISIINTDWNTIYVFIFCLLFGISQTIIADNFLCTHGLLQYPLNTNPLTKNLGYCIPEYMIFCWSLFAFLSIKSSIWFNTFNKTNNKIISIITSFIFAYILIISMEISTGLPEINGIHIINIWKPNTENDKITLVIGGLASYLIIPELILSLSLSTIYHLILQPISNKGQYFKYITTSILSALLITYIYYISCHIALRTN